MSKKILYLGLNSSHYQTEGQIIHWPLIEIVARPLTDFSIRFALDQFKEYSHIIITSKSTVSILKNYLEAMNLFHLWKQKKTIAVGQITAKYLSLSGIISARVAQNETAEGILEELLQINLKQAHLFWPHSSQARLVIKDFLESQGIIHTTCELYDPQPCLSKGLPDLEQFDEVVFTSPSVVSAFFQLCKTLPAHLICTAIGPITAQCLNQHLLTSK